MADKEATVYVVDVGRSTGKKRNGRDQSDLEWSMNWVWDKITSAMLTGRKTLQIGVIGLRTDETRNQLHSDDGYSNLSVLSPIGQFLMGNVRNLQEMVKPSQTDEGDAFSAIALAIKMIADHCKHLKFKKHIVLVTNGRGSISADTDDIQKIASKISEDGINLTVLGVDFDDPEFGVKEEDKPEYKVESEAILKSICEGCNGIFGTMEEAISELGRPRIKPVRPIPLFKGTLTLGDPTKYDTAITIRVNRYPRIKIAKPPTASSYVHRPGVVVEQPAAASTRNGDDHEMTNAEGLLSVRNARIYQVEDEKAPGGKREVEFDDLAKGYEYGRTAVAISTSDQNVTELETEAGLDIVGFVPKNKFERQFEMSETHTIIAEMIDDKGKMAFSSLIRALFELESYAIARFVKKEGAHPLLLMLAPSIEPDYECLIDCEIPFAEDIRQYSFPPLDRIITVSGKTVTKHRNLPEPELQSAMDELVDHMDLSSYDKDDEGNPSEYAAIEDTFSPTLHFVNQAIQHHAVHPEGSLPAPYTILTKYMHPPEELSKAAQTYLDAVARTGNVKKVPAKPKFRGRGNKREAEKPLSGLDIDELLRPVGESKFSVNISATNAIPEFKQVLRTTEEEKDIFEAVKQMQSHIETYISRSVGDSGYGRAVEALRIVREELVELEYAKLWNQMLKDIKAKLVDGQLGGDRQEMWWRIKVNRLGLATKDHSADSDVSAEDAKAFWSVKR